MTKKYFLIPVFIISIFTFVYAEDGSLLEPFKKGERLLILAPHPDDEAIGCAGIIQQALSEGAQVKIAYLTNGDYNQLAFIVYEKRLVLKKSGFIYMGEVRRLEAIKAMQLLGVPESNLIFLGYPDFGTLAIFSQYWQTTRPYHNLLTRISSVPYKENFSFQAPYVGESILSDLKNILLRYKPTKIFVSHPLDTNVDHKTFYLFLQIALEDLEKDIPAPKVYPYLIHCLGWPMPRHYHPELGLQPTDKFSDTYLNWYKFGLTQVQLNKKYQIVLSYKSQAESSAFYLLSFVRKNELFSDCPVIELARQSSSSGLAAYFSVISAINNAQEAGEVSCAVIDDTLLVRIEKTKEISRRSGFQIYLFGYSNKTPFAQMPKLHIIARYNKFKAFDKKTKVKPQGSVIISSPRTLIFKIPLQALGDPKFILASLKVCGGGLPIDTLGFRKIVIK